MVRIIGLFFVLLFSLSEAKVNVFAHYFGQPEFIKYQYAFLDHNLLDEYEFVIFEDSNDPEVSEQIREECEKYRIKYVQIPREAFENPKLPIKDWYIEPGHPSFQCCVATQYIYDNYVVHSEDICVILDNDIFLLSPFSIEKYLETYSFAYPREEKRNEEEFIFYMLPNFIIFNPAIMPEKERLDFNMGTIQTTHTDSGGYTYFYLLDHASLGNEMSRYYLFDTPSSLKERFEGQCPLMFGSSEWLSHYFIEKETFLHIRMGSNWSRHPSYLQMREEIDSLFQSLLPNYIW